MPNPFRRSVSFSAGALVPVLLLCLSNFVAPSAIAQSTPLPTGLQKQLDRTDFAISAAGIITSTVSGTEQRDQTPLTIDPTSTVGELVTLRYTRHPYLGFEFNFSNSRYNQNFIYTLPTQDYLPGGVQNTAREYTLGYIAHPPHKFFGIQPFLGAGGGTIGFTPTTYGGEGLKQQYRAAYYYTVGGEANFPDSHFGVRVAFRQLIYLAPDFGQNYITITRRPITTEPTAGIFVRF